MFLFLSSQLGLVVGFKVAAQNVPNRKGRCICSGSGCPANVYTNFLLRNSRIHVRNIEKTSCFLSWDDNELFVSRIGRSECEQCAASTEWCHTQQWLCCGTNSGADCVISSRGDANWSSRSGDWTSFCGSM